MNIKPARLKVFVAAVFSVALVALCSTQAYAEKSENSGMKKNQKKAQTYQRDIETQHGENQDGRRDGQGERGRPDIEGSGLEKQREKKMAQERKELGEGSEKGQEMREEHSRKWWKFWGE